MTIESSNMHLRFLEIRVRSLVAGVRTDMKSGDVDPELKESDVG